MIGDGVLGQPTTWEALETPQATDDKGQDYGSGWEPLEEMRMEGVTRF